ncbi:MAG: trigger factor [Chloroflexi bacterium]|nr:trigger factor [Chloroflexota bacterium]|tara:strand:- start:7491 stop:8795 length:1305 start_codon:yes stop_codon:yes gene_type:complete
MKISTEKTDQQQINLTIEVNDEDMESHIQIACNRMSKKMNFPGFRKGKVPRSVLENSLGKQRLVQESLDTLIPEVVFKAVDKEKIEIVATPVVSVESLDPKLKILAKVALVPIVNLSSYEKFKIVQSKNKIGVKEINNVIDQVRESQLTWIPVERSVKRGDSLIIDFEINSDEKTITSQNKMEFIVDYGKDHVESIPGFSEKLIKMNIGDEKKFNLKFPENFPDEKLRNKSGEFKVLVHEIKEKALPELNDDFAKSLGEGLESVKELKEKVRENLKLNAENEWNNRIIEDFINQVMDDSKFVVAPILVDQESENIVKRQKEYIESRKLDFDEYLKNSEKTYEGLLEESREVAEKNIFRSLIINEISIKENIKVEEKEVIEEIKRWEENNNKNNNISKDQVEQNIRQSIKDRLIMDKILKLAKDRVVKSKDKQKK